MRWSGVSWICHSIQSGQAVAEASGWLEGADSPLLIIQAGRIGWRRWLLKPWMPWWSSCWSGRHGLDPVPIRQEPLPDPPVAR